jgi:hypothetical protein
MGLAPFPDTPARRSPGSDVTLKPGPQAFAREVAAAECQVTLETQVRCRPYLLSPGPGISSKGHMGPYNADLHPLPHRPGLSALKTGSTPGGGERKPEVEWGACEAGARRRVFV